MNFEHERRILELLEAAMDRSPQARAAFLDEACAGDPVRRREVEALLRTEENEEESFFDRSPFADAVIGRHIGAYRVVRELGRGGMARVYLAERSDDFRQKVALKLIKHGMDSDEILRRFAQERQILADLEHPSIARLLDGGTTTGGAPYFAMEFIEGEHIHRYCDAARLSIRQRLELFLEVASAVHVAHQSLIIHRDLKPSNILVTGDRKPKLLDFGIAKLLDPETRETHTTARDQRFMTLPYASPEQVRGDRMGTSSDLYSLGVVLYQLLTGHLPYPSDLPPEELRRRVCDEEPKRPSAVGRRSKEIRGDLDSIVLKAMEKDPARRYGSVSELMDDVRRYLNSRPVEARAGTFLYRTGKLVHRHRWTLAVLLLFFGLGLTTTVVWQKSLREQAKAEWERERAERERTRADRVVKSLTEILRVNDAGRANARPLDITSILKSVAKEYWRDEPELFMVWLNNLADTHSSLGHHDEALVALQEALDVARGHYGEEHPEVAKRLNNLGAGLYETGVYEEARERFSQSLEMRRRLGQAEGDMVRDMNNLASLLMELGKFEGAREIYERVLEIRIEQHGRKHKYTATTLRNLGLLFYVEGKAAEAEPYLREALGIRRDVFDPDDLRVASVLNILGDVLEAQGRDGEAEALYRDVLEMAGAAQDRLHAARARRDLAALRLKDGDAEGAVALLRQARADFAATLPADHWESADARSLWGSCLVLTAGFEAARPHLLESYQRLRTVRGEKAIYTRRARQRLCEALSVAARPSEELATICKKTAENDLGRAEVY